MSTKQKDIRVGPVHHFNRRTKACLQDLLGLICREEKTSEQHKILQEECKKAMDVHKMLQLPAKRKYEEAQQSLSNDEPPGPRIIGNDSEATPDSHHNNNNNHTGDEGRPKKYKKKQRRVRLQSKPGFTAQGKTRIFITHQYVDRSFELHPVFVDNDDSLFEDYFRCQIEQNQKREAESNQSTDASGDKDDQVSDDINEKNRVPSADGDTNNNGEGGEKNYSNAQDSVLVDGDKNCERNVEAQSAKDAEGEDSNEGSEIKEIVVEEDGEEKSTSDLNDEKSSVVELDSLSDANSNATTQKEDFKLPTDECFNKTNQRIRSMPFPLKLHTLLYYARKNNLEDVVCWLEHGRAFRISKTTEFESKVMCKFFNMSRITSFNRQLNLYGFRRLSRGRDEGAYYHEFFLRGKHYLTINIVRTRVKGTKIRAASSPDDEPNFYTMPYVNSGGILRSTDESKPVNSGGILRSTDESKPEDEEVLEPRSCQKKDQPKPVENKNEAKADVDKTEICNFDSAESKPYQISDEVLNSARIAMDQRKKHVISNLVQKLETVTQQNLNFQHHNNHNAIQQSNQYRNQREAHQQQHFPYYQNRMQQEKIHPAIQYQNQHEAHQQRSHLYQNGIQRDIDIAKTMMNLQKSTSSNMMRINETHQQRYVNSTPPRNNGLSNERNFYEQNIRVNNGFTRNNNGSRYNNIQSESNKLTPMENRNPGVSGTETNEELLKSIEMILKGNSNIKYVTLHYDESSGDKDKIPDRPKRNETIKEVSLRHVQRPIDNAYNFIPPNGTSPLPNETLKEMSRLQAGRPLDDSRNFVPPNGTSPLPNETLKEMSRLQAGRPLDDSRNFVPPNGTSPLPNETLKEVSRLQAGRPLDDSRNVVPPNGTPQISNETMKEVSRLQAGRPLDHSQNYVPPSGTPQRNETLKEMSRLQAGRPLDDSRSFIPQNGTSQISNETIKEMSRLQAGRALLDNARNFVPPNGTSQISNETLKEMSRLQAGRPLLDNARNFVPPNGTSQISNETLEEMSRLQAGRPLLDNVRNFVPPNGTNIEYSNNSNRNYGTNIEYSNNSNRNYGASSNDRQIYGPLNNDVHNYRTSNNDNRNYGSSALSEKINDICGNNHFETVAQNASYRSNIYQNFKRSTADTCNNMNTGNQLMNENSAIANHEFKAAVDQDLQNFNHSTHPGNPENEQCGEKFGPQPKMEMRGVRLSLDTSEEPTKNATYHDDSKEKTSTFSICTHVEEERMSQIIPNDGDEERMSQIIPNDGSGSDLEHSEYIDNHGEGDHIKHEEGNEEPSEQSLPKKKMRRRSENMRRKGGIYLKDSSYVPQNAPDHFSDRVDSSKIYLSSESSLSLSEC